jgi:uncharacterized protein
VSNPLMTVSVADLEREENLNRSWDLSEQWLVWALQGTDAQPIGGPGQMTAHLFKNGRQVLVQGKVVAQVQLPCARTLEPAIYDLKSDLVLILSKKADGSPPTRSEQSPRKSPRSRAAKAEKDAELSLEDAASDTYSGDQIVLDSFVREQLLLELPMFPLRSDLRSSVSPAIPTPPQPAGSGVGIDPRVLPLRAIAEKLKSGK